MAAYREVGHVWEGGELVGGEISPVPGCNMLRTRSSVHAPASTLKRDHAPATSPTLAGAALHSAREGLDEVAGQTRVLDSEVEGPYLRVEEGG